MSTSCTASTSPVTTPCWTESSTPPIPTSWRSSRRTGSGPRRADDLTVDAVAVNPDRTAWLVTSASGRDLVLLRSPTSSAEVAIGEPPRTVRTAAELAIIGLDDGLVAIARGSFVDLDRRRVATAAAQDWRGRLRADPGRYRRPHRRFTGPVSAPLRRQQPLSVNAKSRQVNA